VSSLPALQRVPKPIGQEALQTTGGGKRIYGLGLIIALLLLWECSARLGWVASSYWPPFSSVLLAAVQGLASEDVLSMLAATLWRMAAGYSLGCLSGVALGLLLGTSRWSRYVIQPLVEIIRPIPAPAIVPPLILFLGVDDALKIFVIALASFFPAFTSALNGSLAVDQILVDTARTFRIGWWSTALRVILPAMLPAVSSGLRTAVGLSLIVAVVAEMIAGASGIGYFIVQMQYAAQPAAVYAAIVYLAIIGYGLNRLFLAIERRLVPWIGKA
jgi:ABC-type nitrate/sulfonate/bicarbonate transport system permease component